MPGKGASGKAKPSAAAAARGTSGPKGIEWRKVDLDSHFMLANPDQFAGLMSFEVVDGSAYDSMYSGTITQDNVDAEAKAIVDEEDAVRAAKRAKQLANQQAPRKAVVEAEADLSAIAAAAETKAAKEPKLSKPSKAAGVPLGAVAAAKAAPAPAPAAAPAALAQAGKVLGKKRKLEEASPAATPGLASVSSAAPAPAPASTVAAAAAAVPKSKLEQLVAQLQSAHLTKQDRAAVIKAIEEEQARTRKAATAAANAAANAANAAAGAGKGKGQGKPALAPQGQSQGQGKANGKKDEKKQAQQGKQQGKKLLVGKKGVQVSDDDDELDVDEKDDEDLEMDGDVDFDSTEVLSALPEALRKAAMSTAASIKGGAGSTKAGAKAKAKGGKDEEKDEGEEGAGADAEDADAESDAETGSDADANAVDGADAVDGAEGADEPSGATGAFSAWAPYSIHPLLMQGIRGLGFKAPTPIQAACMLPCWRDQRDVVGAAQTGSGKTLAFGLPMLQAVLERRERTAGAAALAARGMAAEAGDDDEAQEAAALKAHAKAMGPGNDALIGLVLTPTRELALQIVDHLNTVATFARIRSAAVVGGLASQKQERLLASRPPIVVATPGRLWELISSSNPTLRRLHTLRFFVLDEADRMVANGHFPELNQIISYVQSFRDPALRPGGAAGAAAAGAAGVGAALVSPLMVESLREANAAAAAGSKAKSAKAAQAAARAAVMRDDEDEEEEDEAEEEKEEDQDEDDDVDQEEEDIEVEDGDEEEDGEEGNAEEGEEEDSEAAAAAAAPAPSKPLTPLESAMAAGRDVRPKRMQVVLFSATLTLKDEGRHKGGKAATFKQKMRNKEQIKGTQSRSMLAVLAERLPFEGKPHIVDFSSKLLIADGVQQSYVQSLDAERDAYLFALLHDFKGRGIVFANSIHIVRRLASILKELRVPAAALHADMIQRRRLEVLDRFKSSKHSVIVCTDVAARGLDIPSVDLVIHYHLPGTPELYVHRCGRTARAGAVGRSIALVCEKDTAVFDRMLKVLGPQTSDNIAPIHLNTHLMKMATSRVGVAQKIAKEEDMAARKQHQRDWLQRQADAAGLNMEDADLDDDDGGASLSRDASRAKGGRANAKLARREHEDDDQYAERLHKHGQWKAKLAALRADLASLMHKPMMSRG